MLMKDFALTASGVRLTFSMKLHGRKDIQSLNSARSISHPLFTVHFLFFPEENDKGCKANTHMERTAAYRSFKKVFHRKIETALLLYLLSTLRRCLPYGISTLDDFHCV